MLSGFITQTGFACILLLFATAPASHATEIAKVIVDGSKTNGSFRAIHGCNGGPVTAGGMIDVSEFHRQAGFPLMRLHDCQWPEPAVVDIHTIFRDFRQDPADASNYYFERTDDYIDSILKSGSQVFYRLGESIEHSKRKYDVHPPKDYEKWAAVCVGIIHHYNDNWANGFTHKIRYWEIWNEPEIRPQMWSGTDQDYYRLYEITAKTIKSRCPEVKVGGPAAANAGDFKDGVFQPTPFVAGLLGRCKESGAPLDFFSWHRYTDDPQELVRRAVGVRQMLDRLGFTRTESHLDEWNYLPRNDWSVFAAGTPGERERFYSEMGGAAGAAFALSALIGLQDAPVNMTYFYTSGTDGFGLFSEYGAPKKVYYAFKAFRALLETPVRLDVAGNDPGLLVIAAGVNAARTEATIVLANYRSEIETVQVEVRNLPWRAPTLCELSLLNAQQEWSTANPQQFASSELSVRQALRAPSICVLKLSSAAARSK